MAKETQQALNTAIKTGKHVKQHAMTTTMQ